MGPDLSMLDGMLGELRQGVETASGESGRRQLLMEIFRVNNETGRLARAHPPLREALVAFQGCLNAATMAVKRGEMEEASRALGLAERAFADAKNLAKSGKNL